MKKVCGNCKDYIRCDAFVDEDDKLAEWCSLYKPKKVNSVGRPTK